MSLRGAKVTLAGIAGVWIGLCATAGAAGMLAMTKPFPVIGIFVGLPLAAAALASAWPAARRAMLSVPMPLMIGIRSDACSRCCFSCWRRKGGWPVHSRTRPRGRHHHRRGSRAAAMADDTNGNQAHDRGGRMEPVRRRRPRGRHRARRDIGGRLAAADIPCRAWFGGHAVSAMGVRSHGMVPLWLVLHAVIWVQLRRQTKPSLAAGAAFARTVA